MLEARTEFAYDLKGFFIFLALRNSVESRGGGGLERVIQLFWGFFKVGILGYGGGPGSISLMQAIAVSGYHWMDNTQFAEMLAIGNALPGPIATKLSVAIGWRVAGPIGAVAALIGVVGPSVLLMLGLYQVLLIYKSNPYVTGLIRGVKPIVIVLLTLLVLNLIPDTFHKTRWLPSTIIFLLGFIAIRGFRISPVFVILASMVGGALFLR
jgi:chromate transporter